jgi:hypothetical protein
MLNNAIAALQARSIDPPKNSGLDTAGFARANDGQTYVIKSNSKHPLLCATEAFCEVLAQACQLPNTFGAWVDVKGEDCYGSRFEGGLDKDKRNVQLQIDAKKRRWLRCTTPGIATAAFAFDLFVFNIDRHHNNMAFQDQNGNITARYFDFSRAWWVVCGGDVAQLPVPSGMQHIGSSERTCATFRNVSKWVGLDLQAAQNVLDLLRRIDPAWVSGQFQTMPPGWLDKATFDSTLAWWGSPLKEARIAAIEQGLKNATLF